MILLLNFLFWFNKESQSHLCNRRRTCMQRSLWSSALREEVCLQDHIFLWFVIYETSKGECLPFAVISEWRWRTSYDCSTESFWFCSLVSSFYLSDWIWYQSVYNLREPVDFHRVRVHSQVQQVQFTIVQLVLFWDPWCKSHMVCVTWMCFCI